MVEPAGAAAVAALMEAPASLSTSVEPPVVAVLSGGNIDPLLMLRVLRHGMSAAGRYLQFRLLMPDRPGSLAAVLAVLADNDANVLEVEHVRTGAQLRLHDVEIGLQLETKGSDHCAAVLSALQQAGYTLVFS